MKPKTGRVLKCKVCGKEFYAQPSRIAQSAKYCSYQCAGLGQRKNKPRTCAECGKEYYRAQSQVKWRGSKYCSKKCQSSHKKKTGAQQGPKSGQWGGGKIKITVLDKKFAKYIKYRDGYRCMRCHKQYEPGAMGLHNSHFIGRANKAVRFDPDNCDAACYGCHRHWEGYRATEYRDWKIAQLGEEGYDALVKRSNVICKRTTEDMATLSELVTGWLYTARDKFEGGIK